VRRIGKLRDAIANLEPARVMSLLPWSLALAGAAALVLIGFHTAFQRRTDVSQSALAWTLLAMTAGMVFAVSPPVARADRHDRHGLLGWGMALNIGALLLFVPVYAAVWESDWDTITGWRTYPYFNKRWLAALYGIAIAVFLVLPVAITRWLTATPPSSVPLPVTLRRRPIWWWSIELTLLLAAVWYLVGPPWNVAIHHRAIDLHEQVHLGPLQAVDKGHLPYLGPASTQYGPGTQLALYAYMSMTEQFNLVGFREAFLLVHLICVALFAVLAHAHTGWRTAWLVLLVGVICSPIRFFAFTGDGALGESYGWGNAGRYLAPLILVPGVAILLTREVRRWLPLSISLGVVWGLLAWFAQENLASGLTGTALVAIVLFSAGATSWSRMLHVGTRVIMGSALVWVPLLGWYAAHGVAGQFVSNYFVLPRAVAAGFQNTWFGEGGANPLANAFHYVPVFAIAVAVLTLWDVTTWRLRRLERDHVRLLSFVCVLLASFQGALYRSDSLHTLNVFLALPFVVVLSWRDLPHWTAATWTGRAAIRSAFVVLFLWMLPLQPYLTGGYDWILYPPSLKFAATVENVPVSSGVAFERATAHLSDEPTVAGEGSGPMRQFLSDASELHRLIGGRPTFVESAGPYFTGLVYFMADLTPAPYLYDVETMMFNNRQQTAAWAHFQKNLAKVECVITSSTDAFEARAFLSANPRASVTPMRLGAGQIYVIMHREGSL
jgi:hypothetical protein